ncbi:MAG: aminotransferase class I/II-fold pyridoxal phosphate-dependent enzyme [Planctomycetaceae bacterium]
MPSEPSGESPPRLAIFGAPPTFVHPLHVGRPNIGDRERLMARINGVLDRNWLTNGGPLLHEFEARVSREVGVKHCVAMANGTVALEIAIRALELSGEVIVPAFTFVATAHALQWQQITPVFCDVDPETHNIDVRLVEELITPRTTGIIGVHLWGRGCDVQALEAIADRHHLDLLFDAAHAFGCSVGGRMIGGFGRCEVFSFHATKFVHCGEGGAVVTNDDALASRIRSMRNFGFAGYDSVDAVGTNGKMSELSAAMGLTSLESSARFVAVNRANHERYAARISRIPGLRLTTFNELERANYQYVIVEVDREAAGLSRDELVRVLFAENVLARRYFAPGCHRMEPYRMLFANHPPRLPVTESLSENLLALPTGTQLADGDIERVCGILARAIDAAPMVRRMLTARRAA